LIWSSPAQLSSAKFFIGQAQLSSAQRKFFKFTTLLANNEKARVHQNAFAVERFEIIPNFIKGIFVAV
jgi:hypothetical protein